MVVTRVSAEGHGQCRSAVDHRAEDMQVRRSVAAAAIFDARRSRRCWQDESIVAVIAEEHQTLYGLAEVSMCSPKSCPFNSSRQELVTIVNGRSTRHRVAED